MAADGHAFAVSLGIYVAIAAACFIFFGFARKSKLLKRYYCPKRYSRGSERPKRLPNNFIGWWVPVYKTDEAEIIRVSGVDSAMYLRVIKFGVELFLFLTFWCCVVVLPTNLKCSNLDKLESSNNQALGPYIYWVPPPAPVTPNSPPAPTSVVTEDSPSFYLAENEVPPAPPGLVWHKYKPEVPSLPPAPPNYTWYRDSNFQVNSYEYTNMDRLTMSNVENRSDLLWVHLISVYVVSGYIFMMLWRYSRSAVTLRLQFLQTAEGARPKSIFVQDIPGPYFGTIMHRLDQTVLRFLPGSARSGLKRTVSKTVHLGGQVMHQTAGRAARVVTTGSMKEKEQIPMQSEPTYFESTEVLLRSDSQIKTFDSKHPRSDSLPPPQTTDLPDFANEPPADPKIFQSVTDEDAWGRARRILDGGTSVGKMLEREYSDMYPNQLAAVHPIADTSELDPLVKEYKKIMRSLTDLLDDYTSRKRRKKEVKRKKTKVIGAKYGDWGIDKYGVRVSEVDCVEWYVARLEELRRLILLEQNEKERVYTGAAFITFKNTKTQVAAISCLQHSNVQCWRTAEAPDAEAVIWGNTRWRGWEQEVRFLVITALFIILTLFYLIPVTAIQSLLNVDNFKKLQGLRQLFDIAAFNALITAILPALVLRIFLLILPMLLRFMGRLEGKQSQTELDFFVVSKYFAFQVVTVFLGSFIAGNLAAKFTAWIQNPRAVINIVGTAAPLTSIFFITYIQLNALLTTPIMFLRPIGVVFYWLLSIFAATERAKARLWQDQPMVYGTNVPQHTIVILLGVVFSVINPLICPMALLYFLMVTVTEKYNVLYVAKPQYESGGQLWRQVFGHVITALAFFLLFMFGIFLAKRAWIEAGLIVPLAAFLLLFAVQASSIFQGPFKALSMRAAADLDAHQAELREEGMLRGVEDNNQDYLAPAWTFDQEEYDQVMVEATIMKDILSGQKAVEPHKDEPDDDIDTPRASATGTGGLMRDNRGPNSHPARSRSDSLRERHASGPSKDASKAENAAGNAGSNMQAQAELPKGENMV